MEIKGAIHLIEQTQEIGEKGFKKRLLVVKTDSEWKNLVPIEFTKDNVDLLDKFSEGDEVVVGINIGGQAWEGKDGVTKYFPSINGWRISKTDDAPAPKSNGAGKSHAEAMEEKAKKKEAEVVVNQEDEDDGLPF